MHVVSWFRKVGVNCEITDEGDSAVQANNQLLAAVNLGDSGCSEFVSRYLRIISMLIHNSRHDTKHAAEGTFRFVYRKKQVFENHGSFTSESRVKNCYNQIFIHWSKFSIGWENRQPLIVINFRWTQNDISIF